MYDSYWGCRRGYIRVIEKRQTTVFSFSLFFGWKGGGGCGVEGGREGVWLLRENKYLY